MRVSKGEQQKEKKDSLIDAGAQTEGGGGQREHRTGVALKKA